MSRSKDSAPLPVPANEVASSEPSSRHPNCQLCQRWKTAKNPFMRPSGQTSSPRLCNMGEGPGSVEDETGKHFMGRSGRLLRAWMEDAGEDPDAAAWINSVKCAEGTPTLKQIRLCRPFVLRDILRVKPKMLMALGASAGKSLLNDGGVTVKAWRNRSITIPDIGEQPGYTTLTTHPAAYIHGNENAKGQIISDYRQLRRVKTQRVLASTHLTSVADVSQVCKAFAKREAFGIDLEWSVDTGVILSVAMFHPEEGAYWFLVDHKESEWTFNDIRHALWVLCGSTDAVKIGHHYTGDMLKLAEWGINTRGNIIDTFVLTKLIDENYPDKSLEHLVMKFLNYPDYAQDMAPYKKKGIRVFTGEHTKTGRPKIKWSKDFQHAPAAILGPYNAADAQGGYEYVEKYVARAKKQKWWPLYRMYMKAEKILTRNTHEGFLVDKEMLDAKTVELEKEAQALKRRFIRLASRYWYKRRIMRWKKGDLKPHDDDVRDLLFKRMGFSAVEMKKKGPSIDKFTMTELQRLSDPGDKLWVLRSLSGYTDMVKGEPVKVLGLSQYEKLLGSFFKRIRSKLVYREKQVFSEDGHEITIPAGWYFQPGYKIAGAKTGRLSSSPNIQQIPRIVRPAFITRWRKK